jgi:hypothetical protein
MDLAERKVAESEPDPAPQPPLDTLDLAVRESRVGALKVQVLEDHMPGRAAADVVDRVIERLEGGCGVSHRRVNHGDDERACQANGGYRGGS